MFLYSLSMHAADLKIARNHLAAQFPNISRSHLAEALAGAQGFNTSIAMQTAVKSNPVHEKRYSFFNASKFKQRLNTFGYTLGDDHSKFFIRMHFPKNACLPFAIC